MTKMVSYVQRPHSRALVKKYGGNAKEVISGKWGNGEARKKKLKEAGYNPETVQKKVNEMLKPKGKALRVGAIIKIKKGAKQYGKAQGFAPAVYKTRYKVSQISGKRVVFTTLSKGTVIGAVSMKDCEVV